MIAIALAAQARWSYWRSSSAWLYSRKTLAIMGRWYSWVHRRRRRDGAGGLERRKRALERGALLVRERRLAQARHGRGAVARARERGDERHQRRKTLVPACARIAIALEQRARLRDLGGQRVVDGPETQDGREPFVDRAHLVVEAQRAAAKALQARDGIEQDEAGDRRGLHHLAVASQPTDQCPRPAGTQQPTAGRGRQRLGDLLHARMEEFGDLDNLTVCRLHLFAHAREAIGPDFELGHPDRVLVGH